MLLKDVYEEISKPTNYDNSIIDCILEVYSEGYTFYDDLVHYDNKTNKKKMIARYNPNIKDKFYVYTFNEWKSGLFVLASSKYKDNPRHQEACILVKYLYDLQPKTAEEVDDILDGNLTNNESIKKALVDLRWDKISFLKAFDHIDSHMIYAKTHERDHCEHRLYLNCDSRVIYFLALEFMKKCRERGIKYYFKYDIYAARDDNFVIYSNTEKLPIYIEILEEIKNANNLDKYFNKPPVLTKKIYNWIGYGSEPYIPGTRHSFNSLRCDHIEKCIKKVFGSFIHDNPRKKVIFNGKEMEYYEFLIKKIIDYIQDDCIRRISIFKFTKEDVLSSEFRILVFKEIRNHITEIIDYFYKHQEFKTISFMFKGDKIYLSNANLDMIFRRQVKFLATDQNIKKELKKEIKDTSSRYGISDNYALDIHARELFLEGIRKESESRKVFVKRKK